MKKEERQKELAIELMTKLGVSETYKNKFIKNNTVCIFENFDAICTIQNVRIKNKIQELKDKHKILTYAALHERTDSTERYVFLIVPANIENPNNFIYSDDKKHLINAYIWDTTNEERSSITAVIVRKYGSTIKTA